MSRCFVVFKVRKREKVLFHEPNNIITHKYEVSYELNYIAKAFTLTNYNKPFKECKSSRYLTGNFDKKSRTYVAIRRKFKKKRRPETFIRW